MPLANDRRVERDDELPRHRRRPLGVEIARRLGRKVRAGQPGGNEFHHQRERRALGVTERHHRAGERLVCICRRPAVDIQRPAFGDRLAFLRRRHHVAARDLRQREVDDDRLASFKRAGERDRIGAEHRRLSAPRRHRGGPVGEEQSHQSRIGNALRVVSDRPAMVRASDACGRDPARRRHLWQEGVREIDGRIGKAVVGVDDENARPRLLRRRRGEAVDLSRFRLRGIERRAQQAVRLDAVRFGEHERLRHHARIVLARAVALQRPRDQRFRLGKS